ncbi:hypothetical protein SDC9_62917 [bioreactor metagenome]|uniref:Uncharacterized protein n=1 Tax=bioreactor metagenome TaxID=1076179 RepID=A0A644XK13_9ZZZZ
MKISSTPGAKDGEKTLDQKRIDRISELTCLSRTRDLTAEEAAEREILRCEYRAAIRQSLEEHMENIRVVDEKGEQKKLNKKQ